MYTLHIANKNYSSWSLRPWVLMRELGIPFEEKLHPFPEGSSYPTFSKFSPTGLVPVLNDGDTVGCMRMRISFGRRAMRGPARVTDADDAIERIVGEKTVEIDQLSFGPPSLDRTAIERGNAGTVIAAILKPLQRLQNGWCDGFRSDNADDAAHDYSPDETLLIFTCAARNVTAQPLFSNCLPRPTARASA